MSHLTLWCCSDHKSSASTVPRSSVSTRRTINVADHLPLTPVPFNLLSIPSDSVMEFQKACAQLAVPSNLHSTAAATAAAAAAAAAGAGSAEGACGSAVMVLQFLARRWLPMLALGVVTSAVASLSALCNQFLLQARDARGAAAAAVAAMSGIAPKPAGLSSGAGPASPSKLSPSASAAGSQALVQGLISSRQASRDLEGGACVPFETLGVRFFTFLRGYHRALAELADATQQDTLLSFACMPVVLYNLVWLVLCRSQLGPVSMLSRGLTRVWPAIGVVSSVHVH